MTESIDHTSRTPHAPHHAKTPSESEKAPQKGITIQLPRLSVNPQMVVLLLIAVVAAFQTFQLVRLKGNIGVAAVSSPSSSSTGSSGSSTDSSGLSSMVGGC